MAFSIQLFIVAAVFTTVLGQNNSIINRAVNGTNDYFRIAQAELLYKIKLAELQNDAVDVRFSDRLAVLEQHQQLVLNETQQVNQTLIALEALNLIRKYCIHTYDSQFIKYETVQNQFKICMNQARSYGYSLTSNARSYISMARSYVLNQLPRNLAYNCQWAQYFNNQTKLEECYIHNVEIAEDNVRTNLNTAQNSRDQRIFDMNRYVLTAVECSYKVEKDVLVTIALTTKKIDDCVDVLSKESGAQKALN